MDDDSADSKLSKFGTTGAAAEPQPVDADDE